jgi:hypothetical protein
MLNWKYGGDSGKYTHYNKKQLVEMLKDEPIPRMSTRIRLIRMLEKK